MGTNYIYKVAGDVAALVLSDSEFNLDAQRIVGHQPGIARPDFANKMAKQSSFIAEAVAQFIATYGSVDVQDDQATALVVANLITAINTVSPGESIGFIKPFGGATPPSGYLECNGASLLRTSYADLFAAIGFAWGAADGTHFNLPDLRGRFLRGWDHGASRDPDKASRTVCNLGGNTGDNVGSVQTGQVGPHAHPLQMNLVVGTEVGGHSVREGNGEQWREDSELSTGLETRPINANVMYCIKY